MSSSGDGGAEHSLDLSGEVCPFTFVHTRLRLEQLPLGAVLAVTVDHPSAAHNVPRSAIAWGQEILSIDTVAGGQHVIRIRKQVD